MDTDDPVLVDDRGWVKLWRKTEDSAVWQLAPLDMRVFLWLLMHVNWQPKKMLLGGREVTIEAGEIITSYDAIAKGVAWGRTRSRHVPSYQNIRTAMCHLLAVKYCKIQQVSSQPWLHVKVLHWEVYQGQQNGELTGYLTGCQQDANRMLTTTKELKKERKKNICIAEDGFEEFWSLYPRHVGGKTKAHQSWTKAIASAPASAIMQGLRDHLPVWAGREQEFIPYPATWLNQGRWTDEVQGKRGNGNGGPSRSFTAEEEAIIMRSVGLYRDDWEAAQDSCPSDDLWVEVMRRAKETVK